MGNDFASGPVVIDYNQLRNRGRAPIEPASAYSRIDNFSTHPTDLWNSASSGASSDGEEPERNSAEAKERGVFEGETTVWVNENRLRSINGMESVTFGKETRKNAVSTAAFSVINPDNTATSVENLRALKRAGLTRQGRWIHLHSSELLANNNGSALLEEESDSRTKVGHRDKDRDNSFSNPELGARNLQSRHRERNPVSHGGWIREFIDPGSKDKKNLSVVAAVQNRIHARLRSVLAKPTDASETVQKHLWRRRRREGCQDESHLWGVYNSPNHSHSHNHHHVLPQPPNRRTDPTLRHDPRHVPSWLVDLACRTGDVKGVGRREGRRGGGGEGGRGGEMKRQDGGWVKILGEGRDEEGGKEEGG
eukprot:CAMPEP_0175077676 /NCGR_PEP_ID=MMETSP0052_2-20121109/23565_1 /TAXON_ID=51329 ORGANISM="Polytomella parva, Strain SAG 63-3" /NCGR_SAMPLE_ID=MMETSP0052_2 /ASSEMBLY_ACC=CAM_ASM_000194 /LENGTH=364 /DNA_ID=CAMNT_0016347253 /DNA_START=94 /DNA_END=1185 /DNA_ORIENTATION=-